MKSLIKMLAGALLMWTLSFPSYAQTFDFEDLSVINNHWIGNLPGTTGGHPVGNYQNYTWDNMVVADSARFNSISPFLNSAYYGNGKAATSGSKALYVYTDFNSSTIDAYISKAGALFDFSSAYMTSSALTNHAVEVTGWLNGNKVNSQTILLQHTGSQLYQFNMSGIDKVTFSSLGGTVTSILGNNNSRDFLMDDVTLSLVASVPEPSAYAMMIIGLGAIGLMVRKRKAA